VIQVPSSSEILLRRLGEHDEICLRAVMTPVGEPSCDPSLDEPRLDARTRGLVRLAALLALEASTESLVWAVELAYAAGVTDEDVVGALLCAASAETAAQLESGAEPLALALGYGDRAPVRSRAARPGVRG
jgi:alkylhydroperoxidase/carboxymuconolactone decarboxylase family protein YurZ